MFLSIGLVSCEEDNKATPDDDPILEENHPIGGTWLFESFEDTCVPPFLVTPIGVHGLLATYRADGTYLYIDGDGREYNGTYTVFEDTLTLTWYAGSTEVLNFTVANGLLTVVYEFNDIEEPCTATFVRSKGE